MQDVPRTLKREAIEQVRRYGRLCREEAGLRGPQWSGYAGLIATAQEYEVRAEVMQIEFDEQYPLGAP